MSRGWKKRVVIAGVSLAVCFTFTGCGDQAHIDRGSYTGEIHAYVREEESGTRAEFEQLVNTNEAGAETIKNKTYPLCRDYLLAYNGELSDLAADFLRYVKGAGQKIVQQSSP